MEPEKYSGLGIASFIISVVSGFSIFVLMIVAGFLQATTPGGMHEKSAAAVIVGLFLLAFLAITVAGLGLGVGGLFQKNRKKIFAVLGTVFSSAILSGTIFVMLLGMSMK